MSRVLPPMNARRSAVYAKSSLPAVLDKSYNRAASIDKIGTTQILKLANRGAKGVSGKKLGKYTEGKVSEKKVEREEIIFPKSSVNGVAKKNSKCRAIPLNRSDFRFQDTEKVYSDERSNDSLDRTASDSFLRGKSCGLKKKSDTVMEKLFSNNFHKTDTNTDLQTINAYSAPLQKKYSSHHNLASTSHSTARLQQKRTYYKPSSSKSAGSEKILSNGLKGSMSFAELPRKIDSGAIRNHPEQFVYAALKKIESEEWKDKVEGIHIIVQIAETSPQSLTGDLHAIIVALLNECKNLRSSVSRVAIVSLGHLFCALNTKMDNEIEKVCSVLLQKAGDVSNAFIRKDATGSLEDMVKNATASKVLTALISSGLKSKNNAIRTECAASVSRLVDRLGPKSALHSKDAGKLIEVLNTFARDSHPSVRYQGKYGLQLLNQESGELEKVAKTELGDDAWRTVKSILENIQKRGLEGGGATDTPTTSLNRSGSMRRSAGNKFVKLSDSVQRDLDLLRADLTANKWEQRLDGLKRFEEMTVGNTRIVLSDTKLLDAFVGRLNDINSKVALEAMDTYLAILYSVAKFFSTEINMKAVLSQLVTALMSHLPSRSEEHRRLAKECISETIKQIDNASLAAAMAAATKQSNVKQRPFMLRSMSSINASLYRTKPRLIEVLSLPILWENVRSPAQMNSDPEVKKAMKEYAQVLSKYIGKNVLLEQANAFLNPAQKRSLELLL